MLIEAYPEYIDGFVIKSHYECNIPDEEYKELKNNKKELIKYIKVNGSLLIDDYSIEDIGPISDIQTY